MLGSEHEFGHTKDEYRITTPPRPLQTSENPRQLVYKDRSPVLPSFKRIRDVNFAPSLFRDKLVLNCYPFPTMPADVLVAQANFVEGGCILATNFIPTCLDGVGVMVAIKVWAECCRYHQEDQSATCDWFDPDSFNHSLPEIFYEHEGAAKLAPEVGRGVWGYLPLFPPDEAMQNNNSVALAKHEKHVNGTSETNSSRSLEEAFPLAPVSLCQPV